ncbi:hypothetical protein L249_6753 [Ophiocordyceps polyrhachis-furcata BCC 54312]|uniref:Phosphatidylinositol-specific phospholipase C X domain-containing protein n=1 Tax=Ophiocordyceps polyrhachis-furcata BCC 54312 TaxID=1330021 RepID=A0A367LLT2_9HYPO|nr:hypothetical protein L249_6753 [Ophiocordyceps polyrhachis-furcata BCC 54312]
MAKLSVRNLGIHPIELTAYERVERARPGGFFRGLFNGSSHPVVPDGEGEEKGVDEDAPRAEGSLALALPPFTVCPTHFPAPSSDEALRLTFKSSSSSSSTRLRLTVVYFPSVAVLAVLSSANLERWMADLHDDWPLTLLSIPGTHNSPTCYKALPSVRCQAVGIADQLRNGIRFLDVRVSAHPTETTLTLVHSIFPVSLTGSKYLDNLLQDAYRFLHENPSETILLSIKREGTGKATDGQMAKHLKHAYVDKTRHLWWTEPTIPTLGQARGKIVIIRRFALDDDMRAACWDGRGWAIDAQQWPDNCEDGNGGNGCFRIQDFYEVSESQNIEKKIAFSRCQLERASEQVFSLAGMPAHRPDAPVPPFFVNFLSASNFFNASCWPERIAAKVNPAAFEYLCVKHGQEGEGPQKLKVGSAGTGIVVTDWVGANGDWDLIRCIVGMNARLQLNLS